MPRPRLRRSYRPTPLLHNLKPHQPPPTHAPATTSSVPETPATIIQSTPTAPTQPQAAPAQLAPTEAAVPTATVPEVTATVVQPDPTPATQPEPTPAAPAAPAIRAVSARESWEKPHP